MQEDNDNIDDENLESPLNEENENQEIDPIAALNAENEILVADNADMKDRLLRTIAEMENLRKRTAREVGEARTYAIANFARDMLGATDNLSRALSTVPKEARESGDKILDSLVEGIEMTDREMQRLLQANGVKPILSLGEKFDPHKHQAMFEVPNSSEPDGTIVEEIQPGFVIGERILRPALVGIAKGSKPPKVDEKPFEDGDISFSKQYIDKQA
ncbi:MAG: nucleotide exchange factor GrpE [Devosiaceae bacterium]|nr:nucleotide exchange factor GrpE [Devosiaceae bacterium]